MKANAADPRTTFLPSAELPLNQLVAAPTVLKTEMEGATDGQSVYIEIPHDVFEEALQSAPNRRIDQHTVMKVALSNMGSMSTDAEALVKAHLPTEEKDLFLRMNGTAADLGFETVDTTGKTG
ncbi:MAG: hypothetical protein IPJ65_24315 [Archangiaceae bacterium]|nr:hypothetical protein [Archangiaceae bacterium]